MKVSSERPPGRAAETCAFFATAVLALALPCFLYDLNLPDEPRVAHSGYEMLRSGDFLVPALNGEPFLQTPPCFYWVLALWFGIVGTEPEGVARLVPVGCGVGTLVVTYLLARRYAGRSAGLLSAAVLASTFHFWDISHRVTVDMTLTLVTSLAFFWLALLILEERTQWWWGIALGVFAGGAFLVKGVAGLVFLFLAATVTFLRHRELWTSSRALALVASVVAAGGVLLPWIVALYVRDPAYPSKILFEHVWQRAVEGWAHNPSNWQFFHRMLLHAMPWTILLPFVLYAAGRRAWSRSSGADERTARFLELILFFFLLPLAALLISSGKRNVYLLPVMPAVAMLVGTWLARLLDALWTERVARICVWLCALAVPVGLVASLAAAHGRSSGLLLLALLAHFYWLGQWWRRRRRDKRLPPAVAAPERRGSEGELSSTVYTALLLICLCVASWGSLYHVMRNARYTAAPLGRQVTQLANEGYEIVGCGLWEREVAAVAWYLRRPFRHVADGGTLSTFLARRAGLESRERMLALLVGVGEYEALGAELSDWKEVFRTSLRRRKVVVLVRR